MSFPRNLISMYSSRAGVRASTLIALIACPLGCITVLLLPDRLDTLAGGLIFVAAILATPEELVSNYYIFISVPKFRRSLRLRMPSVKPARFMSNWQKWERTWDIWTWEVD